MKTSCKTAWTMSGVLTPMHSTPVYSIVTIFENVWLLVTTMRPLTCCATAYVCVVFTSRCDSRLNVHGLLSYSKYSSSVPACACISCWQFGVGYINRVNRHVEMGCRSRVYPTDLVLNLPLHGNICITLNQSVLLAHGAGLRKRLLMQLT